MKLSRTLIPLIVLALAAAPTQATANIGNAGLIPWGITICDVGDRCETPPAFGAQSDGTRWTFEWGTFTTAGQQPTTQQPILGADGKQIGVSVKRIYSHYHPNRIDRPYVQAYQVSRYFFDGQPWPDDIFQQGVQDFPQFNSVQCGEIRTGADGRRRITSGTAGPGVIGTELETACLGGSAARPEPTGDTQEEGESTQPAAKAQACAPVKVATKKIAVTSLGVGCYSARNILARFVRTGKEPAGFLCLQLRQGKQRIASCATTAKAAKKITGRWRV